MSNTCAGTHAPFRKQSRRPLLVTPGSLPRVAQGIDPPLRRDGISIEEAPLDRSRSAVVQGTLLSSSRKLRTAFLAGERQVVRPSCE